MKSSKKLGRRAAQGDRIGGPDAFEEAARRIKEEGEAMPFEKVLRRLAKATPKHKPAKTPQSK